jgi:hypothetical protein
MSNDLAYAMFVIHQRQARELASSTGFSSFF